MSFILYIKGKIICADRRPGVQVERLRFYVCILSQRTKRGIWITIILVKEQPKPVELPFILPTSFLYPLGSL